MSLPTPKHDVRRWYETPRDERGVPFTRWRRVVSLRALRALHASAEPAPDRQLRYFVTVEDGVRDIHYFHDDASARRFGKENPRVDKITRGNGTVIYYRVEEPAAVRPPRGLTAFNEMIRQRRGLA